MYMVVQSQIVLRLQYEQNYQVREHEGLRLRFTKTFEKQQYVVFEERAQRMRQHLQEANQESSQKSAAVRQETRLTVKAARFNDENNIKNLTTTVP
ncbi:hypothetical protein CU097_012883 [Rhizopus azygosporus]|uniref:Uncharacterized protein n=1 Tax=Rhizopus azygosporus TaxID=86630 RepID=A0A367K4L1_RHIAZ|nr:hypothetical protein CU097_012883 [Rhizopus azygosporus]